MLKKILSKVLPPREKVFFAYFVESAKICNECVGVLTEIVSHGVSEELLANAREFKHRSNDITKKTLVHLNATFIIPLDREDIYYLNKQLNKIARKILIPGYAITLFTCMYVVSRCVIFLKIGEIKYV